MKIEISAHEEQCGRGSAKIFARSLSMPLPFSKHFSMVAWKNAPSKVGRRERLCAAQTEWANNNTNRMKKQRQQTAKKLSINYYFIEANKIYRHDLIGNSVCSEQSIHTYPKFKRSFDSSKIGK